MAQRSLTRPHRGGGGMISIPIIYKFARKLPRARSQAEAWRRFEKADLILQRVLSFREKLRRMQ